MANSDRPPRRWVELLGWLALSTVLLSLGGLLVANVIDHRRYHWAAHFEESEGLDKVRDLARTCFDLGKNGYVKLTEYPEIIRQLKPSWVSIDRENAQIGLYNHDYSSVFLVFEKYDGNLVVKVCDYVRDVNAGRAIFVQDKAAYDFLNPKERIVTLAQGTMHEYVEWIVLADEVRVISEPGSGGPQVLGRRPISGDEKQAIEVAMRSIPAAVKGRHFRSGVIDGIHLHILFGADGRRGSEDIELDNTWREEAGPLVDLIERLSPKEQELKFRSIIEQELKELEFPRKQSAATWAEEAKLGRPPMPWWCIWQRFDIFF